MQRPAPTTTNPPRVDLTTIGFRVVALVGLLLTRDPICADEIRASAADRLSESVRFLSSNELEGRGVGTTGLDRAATYIADRFESLGLRTDLFEGSPFQQFEISADAKQGENNRLTFVGPAAEPDDQPRTIEAPIGTGFNPLSIGGSGKFDLPLVFVGYGITGANEKYDDYGDVNVEGKAVLVLRKEPQQGDENSVFDGRRNSRHALFSRKVANAYEHGAAAVLMVNDQVTVRESVKQKAEDWSEATDELLELRMKFRKNENPTSKELAQHRAEISELAAKIQQLGKALEGDGDQIVEFRSAGPPSTRIPVLFCQREAVAPALQAAFGDQDLSAIELKIDETLVPQSRELPGWRVRGQTEVIQRKQQVKNVVGVLEGEGPLANETVVVGAHYDHLGTGGAGSLAPWTREIHNGADDNASGTAGLIEIARRFATLPERPRRRIVFIAFSAEEKGLKGSRHYISEPRFSLENTVAMVNLDMIGRLNDNRLTVYGTGTATGFDELVEQLNAEYDFDIAKQPSGFGPSDHASFYEKQIPVFHLFTGTHRDYHRPSDDFERINVDGMQRVTGFAGDLVEAIVSADERPEYLQTRRDRRRGGGRGAFLGATLAAAPDNRGVILESDRRGTGRQSRSAQRGPDRTIRRPADQRSRRSPKRSAGSAAE